MFGFNHYVPILKGKAGEFGALEELKSDIKNHITPLIDVPRIFHSKTSKKSLKDHLEKTAENINSSWGQENQIFVDLFDIKLTDRTSDGTHPIKCIFNFLGAKKVKAIPTTGLDRDKNYNREIKKVIQKDQRGVCIRLLREDLDFIDELVDDLEAFIEELNVTHKKIHLLLDFRVIESVDIGPDFKRALTAIDNIPNISDYATLTIAGSSYPQSLIAVNRDTFVKIPRIEFNLWELILGEQHKIKRIPSFGDYAVVHPDLLDLDFRKITLGGKIRYTLDKEWLIFKGRSFKSHPDGYGQFHELAHNIVNRPEFNGPKYSWGDKYIAQCARKEVKCGSLTTWVMVDINHHLTFVGEQVSNAA